MSRKWTDGQLDAIRARGGTLLVSAAAGSGKTAVLVQRVIERITDEKNPTDADRLLVVTFTRAAAAEMRDRIETELSRLLEADPANTRLQRQQILLSRSHISTIDSFCTDLVRQNFYRLGIPPDFRILDENEAAVLRSESADETLEEFYERGDPDFYRFVESFSSGRDDAAIGETVNRLYDFVRSHPFPKRWLKEKAKMYETDSPVPRTVWGKTVFSFVSDAADYCISVMKDALQLAGSDEKIAAAYGDAFRSDLLGLESIRSAVLSGGWDETASAVGNFSCQKLKPLRGYGDDPLKNRLSAARAEVKSTIGKISELLTGTEEECKNDIRLLSPIVNKLFEVTEQFSEILDHKKEERRAVDFSDLEHLALRLLVKETEKGFEFTPESAELAAEFDEIMVDEYQDTNETQDLIFRAVSRNEGNLFLVGDVKQSIYRFRQAMPQIFLRRRAEFQIYDRRKDRYPACVVLDKNFRSRSGVTDAVNFIFRQLMSRQAGELDYSKAEELVPAADDPACGEAAAELDVLDLSDGGDGLTAVQAECGRIAEVILNLCDGTPRIAEHGSLRPAVYRDFCILLRSASGPAHDYVRELTALGIPAWADMAGGFFETYEIGVALSLLRVIDNPMQDIPLLSVMMSPIYGFNVDDMAGIRIFQRSGRLYSAVAESAKVGNERSADFLEQMEGFRTFAATMPSDRLIRTVFEKTGFTDLVQAMPNGELRAANLRLLMEYAKRFEKSGYNGLSGFLRFLDRMQKSRGDLSAASSLSESANVVRVMSIHHSKGLEFPVCILAGCAHQFNRESPAVLLHPELGLGVKLKDEAGIRYDTLPREAVALELQRDEMSEELRILYVALTRAKDKIIMITSLKNASKTLEKLAARIPAEKRIQPYAVRSAACISDWLLLCALRHPDGKAIRDLAGVSNEVVLPASERWDIRVIRPEAEQKSESEPPKIPKAEPDDLLMDQIAAKLDYVYPYGDLNGICAKVAASTLAEKEFSARYAATSRPAFLSEKGMSPTERGTALHAYLQFADFKNAARDPRLELDRLVQKGFITQLQASAVNLDQVALFFKSPVARRITAADRIKREFRFSVEIPAGRVKPDLPDLLFNEPVVLQGAVDCVFEENGKLVVLDYKSDRVNDPRELWEHYRGQLALYRYALERCIGLKVKECCLYSFFMNRAIFESPFN